MPKLLYVCFRLWKLSIRSDIPTAKLQWMFDVLQSSFILFIFMYYRRHECSPYINIFSNTIFSQECGSQRWGEGLCKDIVGALGSTNMAHTKLQGNLRRIYLGLPYNAWNRKDEFVEDEARESLNISLNGYRNLQWANLTRGGIRRRRLMNTIWRYEKVCMNRWIATLKKQYKKSLSWDEGACIYIVKWS